MRLGDLPTLTNGGGVLLALILAVLVFALAALVDARRPKCWECRRHTKPEPERIFRLRCGRYVLLCRSCHTRVAQERS